MATKRTFICYNADGTRNASATPFYAAGHYVTRAGVVRSTPAITSLGNGKFEIAPSDADEEIGVCSLVSTGCSPAYYAHAINTPDKPFEAVFFLNGDGTLISTGTPTQPANSYQDMDGNVLHSGVPPVLVSATAYLWSLTPPDGDLAIGGINAIISAPAGKFPSTYAVELVPVSAGSIIEPVVGNFVPALPGPVQPTQALQFDVTVSDGTPLRNCTVLIAFEGLEVEEAPYDGATFSPLYVAGSTVSVITNGLRFVLKRRGGWPANPIAKIRAVTVTGMINT